MLSSTVRYLASLSLSDVTGGPGIVIRFSIYKLSLNRALFFGVRYRAGFINAVQPGANGK